MKNTAETVAHFQAAVDQLAEEGTQPLQILMCLTEVVVRLARENSDPQGAILEATAGVLMTHAHAMKNGITVKSIFGA